MAQASGETRDTKKNSVSGDFSVISGGPDSFLQNASWPKQDDISFPSAEAPRSSRNIDTYESSQALASHFALATAYQRVTKKLAEAEQRNQQLVMQESLRSQDNFRSARMSGIAGSQTNCAMPPDFEASVNQAWEAYNEKCKECQQLREELEAVRQKSNNSEHFSQIQNLQEDVLREKAKQDDVVRMLEKTKMEADHLGKKEILAREELEKEREYQKTILDSAEKKHRELEQRIEELEINLANEKSLTDDLRRRERDRQRASEEEVNATKESYNSKIRELEERNIALKEEVAVLVSMQTNVNGPMPVNPVHTNGIPDSTQACASENFDDDKDSGALEFDLQILRTELNDLKRKADEQANILHGLYRDPRLQELISTAFQQQHQVPTLDSGLPHSLTRTGPESMPIQSSELLSKRKKTNSPKLRNHGNHGSLLIYPDGTNNNGTTSLISPHALRNSSSINRETFANQRYIPSDLTNDSANSQQGTKVLKSAEEFIRGLSQDGALLNQKNVRNLQRPDNSEVHSMFPAMDVSRTIHTPESASSNTMPAVRSTVANYSSESTMVQSSQNSNLNVSTTTTSSRYTNGNFEQRTAGNSSLPLNTQNSLTPMEEESSQFYSALSSNSLSSTDTLVMSPVTNARPTNSATMAGPNSPTQRAAAQRKASLEILPNVNRNSRVNNTSVRKNSLMELDDDVLSQSRQVHVAASFNTPSNRPVSSDDDNDSFEEITRNHLDIGTHQPKEFVVPKVVRATDKDVPISQRKAFQDSGYGASAAQTQTRPAIRARAESSSTAQSGPRSSRHENGPTSATPHQYPTARAGIRNRDDSTTLCPVCEFEYPADWTESKKSIHVNGHFSDEDNGVMALE